MNKIYINNFTDFFTCINRTEPVYIERIPDDGFLKNELYGVIRPMIINNTITIFSCLKHDNIGYMTPLAFEKMIITLEFDDITRVKQYAIDRALELYNLMSNDFKLFIVDDLFYKYMSV